MSVTVFAQGMRRSGTTVLFDLVLEDGRFTCFYEPLAAAKPTFGGGSGIHRETDLFEPVRAVRERFLVENPHWLQRYPEFRDLNLFNYGAPRSVALEFEPDLPDYCKGYIGLLCNSASNTFIKFTRMHAKVACLKEIAPDAKLIHVVRDPRQVTASYLFGKNQKNRARFRDSEHFFTRVSDASAWSSRLFSDFILSLPRYRGITNCEDFQRILLIWKYKFERTHTAGLACFGPAYLLVQHEELLADPAATLERIGDFIGHPFKPETKNWALRNLRKPVPPFAEENPRWRQAFERLGMEDALFAAGYGDLLAR